MQNYIIKMVHVICLSGKRFVGKSTIAEILKNYCLEKNLTVKCTSFSYFLKKEFCEKYGHNLERMVSDHEYKDSLRDSLTAYLDKQNPIKFTQLMEKFIDLNEFDVYIIDDLRSYDNQVKYLKEKCSHKWNIYYVRINSTDESRKKRGWIKTQYDDHIVETDLDNYTYFDYVINNDSTINDLFNIVSECKKLIF